MCVISKMKHNKRNIALLFLGAFVLMLAAGCSNKGVQMPKHRKRRHCNCPTFSMVESTQYASPWTETRL